MGGTFRGYFKQIWRRHDDLLDLVVLTDLAELEGDNNATPTGHVIESKTDPKRGNTATLIIKEGTLRPVSLSLADTYQYVSWRFSGKPVKEAGLSTPVRIVGFTEVPEVGVQFLTVTQERR